MHADRLTSFLTDWYGSPPVEPTPVEGALPLALRRWYGCVQAWGDPLTRQNYMIAAKDLVEDDGYVVFYVENQNVCEWAFRVGDEDPEVFDRECRSNQPWEPIGERLEDFLFHVAAFETVFSQWCINWLDLDAAQVQSVVSPMRLLATTTWGWPGPNTSFYRQDGVLAMAAANQPVDAPVTEDSRWLLFVGCRSQDDLDAFDRPGLPEPDYRAP